MSPQKTSPQYQSDQKTEKKFTYGPKLADDNLTVTSSKTDEQVFFLRHVD